VDKGSKGRLYTSDESNLASGRDHQDGAEGKTSPRDTTSGDASDGSDEHSATTREGGRRRVGRNSAHVRSDSVGAILSITQRPGGRRTPRLRFLDVPLEILAEEMSAHEIRHARVLRRLHRREGEQHALSLSLSLAYWSS
jgi:hypothetical protein